MSLDNWSAISQGPAVTPLPLGEAKHGLGENTRGPCNGEKWERS